MFNNIRPNDIRPWVIVLALSALWALLTNPAHQNLGLLAASDGPSNILLLTAHPDDECMFFAPTILALLGTSTMHSLCLSVGDADGLGATRRDELTRSLDVLGIEEGRRWVVDTPGLRDNFTSEWDVQLIADVLKPYVLENHISTILTFDQYGISSHPNHISLPKGAAHLIGSFNAASETHRPRLFTLLTVPLHEKYLGLISALVSKAFMFFPTHRHDSSAVGGRPVVVTSWAGFARAHRAMREHWSQLVWFRWLYVLFSRYMWVNEWVELLPRPPYNS